MKNKTLVAKGLTIVLASAFILEGCGSTQNSGKGQAVTDSPTQANTEAADQTESGERPTITVAVSENEKGEYSDENYAIKWIEEQTGVNISFVALPSDASDAETKLNLMLSSGDYPDVINYGLNKQKTVTFGTEGFFIPINDLIDQYGDNVKTLFEKRPQYEKNSYAPDGNIYGFPTENECYHCTAYPKLWYNTAWLDSLGLKEPSTTDELEEVLTAIKNSDYNGNGKADEIPLTGSPDWDCQLEWWLMNSFVPCDKNTLSYLKDNKVTFACNTDEFKQGLKYMNELYNNGLIDPSMFSQSSDQMQQTIRSDEKLVFGYTADHFGMGIDLENAELNKSIAAMVPVESPTGARYQEHKDYVDMTEGFNWFITDKCADPVSAFKVGDFLMSDEASMIQQYGEEGTFWRKLDTPVPSILNGVDAVYSVDPGYTSDSNTDTYQKNVWWTGLQNNLAEFRASMSPKPDEDTLYTSTGYEARLFEETEKVEPYFYSEYLPRNVFLADSDESSEFATLQTSLQEYVKTSMAQFITGEMSIDKDWNSYCSTIDGYNVGRYIELYQKAYNEYNSSN